MSNVFTRPLPPLSASARRRLAFYNGEQGKKYNVTTNRWSDRRFESTGDPRAIDETRKIQRLLGLMPTGKLDRTTLARMLAHIEANTRIGKALRLNFIFTPNPMWNSPQIPRPTKFDLDHARRREAFVAQTIRAQKALTEQKARDEARRRKARLTRKQPQASAQRSASGRRLATRPHSTAVQQSTSDRRFASGRRPAAPQHLSTTEQRPRLFTPAWWAQLRQRGFFIPKRPAAPKVATLPPRKKTCICGYTRAELASQISRLRVG